MELWSEAQARRPLGRALRAAKLEGAGEALAELTRQGDANLRFANNGVTTSGEMERHALRLEVAIGARHATLETEDLSEEGLSELAARAVEAAKALPEDPEHVPLIQGQPRYPDSHAAYDAATAAADPRARAAAAGIAIGVAHAAGLLAAGYVHQFASQRCLLGSPGFFGSAVSTGADFQVTVRQPDGSSSGWAGAAVVRTGELDVAALAQRAIQKAKDWRKPVALAPGAYTVVLEAQAVGTLLGYLDGAFDQRDADEGRSALSRPGGGTRLGEQVFSERVSLVSDPHDTVQPGDGWTEGGQPTSRLVVVDKGVLTGLRVSRYWAQKTGRPPAPGAGNLRLSGSGPGAGQTLDDLIAGCERGLLVTHVWYVRGLNPQTASVTGLTRDATFLIERGKITSPVKNFRFNQSLVDWLKAVEAVGQVEQALDGPYAVPPLRVRDFQMSSRSDAV